MHLNSNVSSEILHCVQDDNVARVEAWFHLLVKGLLKILIGRGPSHTPQGQV